MEGFYSRNVFFTPNRMGHVVQEQGGSKFERGDSIDKGSFNRNFGLV